MKTHWGDPEWGANDTGVLNIGSHNTDLSVMMFWKSAIFFFMCVFIFMNPLTCCSKNNATLFMPDIFEQKVHIEITDMNKL